MQADEEFSPDPRRVTIYGGVFFNPWINIPVSAVLTIGLGWMTAWFWSLLGETVEAPPYEDQGLDTVGLIIGVVFGSLATAALFVVTIGVIIWWAKRIRRTR